MLAHLLLLLPMEQDRERVWFLYQKLKEKLMYAVMKAIYSSGYSSAIWRRMRWKTPFCI